MMKRVSALLLAAVLVLGAGGFAKADGIDIKVKGQWDFAFGWANNMVFKDNVNRSASMNGDRGRGDNDRFQATQRIRTQINFITSEYLQGVLMFEIGNIDWGSQGSDEGLSGARTGRGSGGALDADGVNIETKRAYLDWIIPYTEVSVRMGIQGLALPSTAMGNPVFDADVAGIVVSSPITDWLAVTGFWIRPFNYSTRYDDNRDLDDETDAFGIVLPFTFDGISFAPYFVYGFLGAGSGVYSYIFDGGYSPYPGMAIDRSMARDTSSNVWWAGLNFELSMFDPLVFSFDAIYGHLRRVDLGDFLVDRNEKHGAGAHHEIGTSGWYIGATLDYKLDFMTPGIFGWWASGDKDDADKTGKLGRIPVLGTDGGFAPTSFGANGYYNIGQFDTPGVISTGAGTWGIGIQLAEISFIEDLSHTLRFAYYQGTNDSELIKKGGVYLKYDADPLYLTDEDQVFEVNFDHQYQIYENLAVVLELGWLHLDSDKSTWRRFRDYDNRSMDDHDDAWKAQVSFRYDF